MATCCSQSDNVYSNACEFVGCDVMHTKSLLYTVVVFVVTDVRVVVRLVAVWEDDEDDVVVVVLEGSSTKEENEICTLVQD